MPCEKCGWYTGSTLPRTCVSSHVTTPPPMPQSTRAVSTALTA